MKPAPPPLPTHQPTAKLSRVVLPLWRRVPLTIANSVVFDVMIMLLIILDGIFFGIAWSPSVQAQVGDLAFSVESIVVTAVFCIEVILKWFGLGPKAYFRSMWNWVDFVVTIISLVVLIVNSFVKSQGAGAVVFFRLLRLVRFVRVVAKVRAIATKARAPEDVRLPAARCIDSLQRLKRQLKDAIPKKRKDETDDRVTHEDLMYIIDQIRDRTLYTMVFGGDDLGDEEMQAYLQATANIVVEDTNDKKSVDSGVRRRSSQKASDEAMASANWVRPTSMSIHELLEKEADVDVNAIEQALSQLASWDFDVFAMTEMCHGHELVVVAYQCFMHYNLFFKFKIPQDVFLRFVRKIESGYKPNPYHNHTHATDVLQGTFAMLVTGGVGKLLTDMEIFACLLSAIVHDYEHPGVNNAYLSNINHELALRYNDKAVLEMHHIAAAFALMHSDASLNLFVGMSKDDYKSMRQLMIDIVLGTEMAVHFECVSIFKSKMEDGGLNLDAPADRTLAMKMMVHVADISNPARNIRLAGLWTENVMQEFFNQGDEERSRGLKISPFMDRATTSVAKCQIGFIDFIVKPLQTTWATFLKQDLIRDATSEMLADSIMANVQANRDFWNARKELEEAAAASLVSPVSSTSRLMEGSPAASPAPIPSSPALEQVRKSSLNSSRRGSISSVN